MGRTSDQLLADLQRVKRRIARIESALTSETERERQIERRHAARLKFVIGGDVVGRAKRGEVDAMSTLTGVRDRARERDRALFAGRVPTEYARPQTPPTDDTEPPARDEA